MVDLILTFTVSMYSADKILQCTETAIQQSTVKLPLPTWSRYTVVPIEVEYW